MATYADYIDLKTKLQDPIYDFSDKLITEIPPSLHDGMVADANSLLLQENTTYIIGSMTIAVLLITAIMMASE